MNLDFSDDQRMLSDSIDRLVADHYPFDKRVAHAESADGWSRAVWSELASLGLLMLPFAEADGGLGLGGVEMMIVGEAFGRGLLMEPYLASIVLAGGAIAAGGTADQRARLLPTLMSGERLAALADGDVRVEADGATWRLSGRVALALGGDAADLFVIAASDGLYLVPADAPGLARRGYRLHGGGGAADLVLDAVAVPADDRLAGAGALVRALEGGIAFLAAEAAGAMRAALDITVDYLKTREQFGKPIGSNQALQHRAAEMLVEVEQARSAALYAALLQGDSDPQERARGMAAVKAVIGRTGRFVAQQVVQLHGGIGVSEEHVASHYFRRLTAIDMLLGNGETQVRRLAALGGFTSAAPHG